MTQADFGLCSLSKSKTCCGKLLCVYFDNIISPHCSSLLLQLDFKTIHDRQDRRHISTEHSVSFFIYGNGYPGDSILVVAMETQQQKQSCCQAERGCWFNVTLNRFSVCFVSFHLLTDPALVYFVFMHSIRFISLESCKFP